MIWVVNVSSLWSYVIPRKKELLYVRQRVVAFARRKNLLPVPLHLLSGILNHPSMYKVPIRWYNLSLICIGWISGPDFGALGMCSSHWKVVKGVIQPRTWENGPFRGYVT
jgi:hypothetical protein